MNLKLVTLTLLIGLGLTWPSEAFAAKEKFVFVDIKKKANASLEKEWWTGAPKKTTYALLPLGKMDKFDGPGDQKVEFRIEKKALVLYGNNCQQLPKKIEGIKIDPKAQKIKNLSVNKLTLGIICFSIASIFNHIAWRPYGKSEVMASIRFILEKS